MTAVYRANGVCFAGNAVVAMTSQQQWRHSNTAAAAVAGTPTSEAAEYSTESAEGEKVEKHPKARSLQRDYITILVLYACA